MYTMNGIVYAGEPEVPLKVVAVRPLDNWKLRLCFSTGEVKCFDFTPFLAAPCFQPLKEASVFAAVQLDHGVPIWCEGAIDIAPEKLYQDGVLEDCANGD